VNLLLYFHTIRYLKFKQICYRILRFIYKPSIKPVKEFPQLTRKSKIFANTPERKESLIGPENFFFLNNPQDLSLVGWNNIPFFDSYLWRYNQHYFDDLNALKSSERIEWHKNILKRWVDENPIGNGVGWEPYPLSLRIVNLIKWHNKTNQLDSSTITNLYNQALFLSKNIEYAILGNHLFANAKALIFSSCFFRSRDSESWLKTSVKIIKKQLREQVLEDGSHFELSPMYHSIFLEDVLDIINLSNTYTNKIPEDLVISLKEVASKMLYWLNKMKHPDNEISFFGDSAINVCPSPSELESYAARLGIEELKSSEDNVTFLKNSGYIRVEDENIVAILDVGRIGPEYLPAHGHADTLSFEFSIFNQRVLVNSGTSCYEVSEKRSFERSTAAHNTVEVNETSSSEVWSSFRVARRAYPSKCLIGKNKNNVEIKCSHNGYKRLKGKPIHTRTWVKENNSFCVKDMIEGQYKSAISRLFLHPQIAIIKSNDSNFFLRLPLGQEIKLEVIKGSSKVVTSSYSPEFGLSVDSSCIEISLNNGLAEVRLSYN